MNKTASKSVQKRKTQVEVTTLLATLGRIEFHKRRRTLRNEQLEKALHYFFSHITLVESYMKYKSVTELCDQEGGGGSTVVSPLDEALLAAHQAAGMVQDIDEQEVVYAASLMYPCGTFLTDHPVIRGDMDPATPLQEERSQLRELMLEKSLNWLSQANEELGWLMRYLLNQVDHAKVVPVHWKSLREAVERGQVRIKALW